MGGSDAPVPIQSQPMSAACGGAFPGHFFGFQKGYVISFLNKLNNRKYSDGCSEVRTQKSRSDLLIVGLGADSARAVHHGRAAH